LQNPKESISKVLDMYKSEALVFDETDGISLEFADWRFNLRSSNTEPVVRLNVESRADIALMEERTKAILSILCGK
ncbi:phosphomannomutase CpsG, partial [Vibrio breoganii]